MSSLFTVKVRYTKQLENGSFKRVTEPYVLTAMSFTDAEARIYEELGSIIRGEFVVVSITRTELQDIFVLEGSDVFYKVTTSFDSVDEETERSKKQKMSFLITADSVKDATEKIREELNTWLADYTIDAVAVTPIVEFFPFKEVQYADESDYKSNEELVDELP
jgi:hypothetical protein